MLEEENKVIKRGYKKMPDSKVKQTRVHLGFDGYKYPVNELREPKGSLCDSMAVCEYSNYNIGLINAYVRSVMNKRFPERKFALRKQMVERKFRVVVYRIQ